MDLALSVPTLFLLAVGSVLAAIVAHLVFRKPVTVLRAPRLSQDVLDHLTMNATLTVSPAVDLDEPFRRAAANVREHPPVEAKFHPKPREFGKRVAPRHPVLHRVSLSPRILASVNRQRKLTGRPMLNRDGFSNAVAHAWDQPRRQPDTTNEWLTYFILYQCFIVDHQSRSEVPHGGITIDPEQPYNGHGGEFGGAGATGTWTPADDAMSTTLVAKEVTESVTNPPLVGYDPPLSERAVEPSITGNGYHYASPDPDPTPSAPDPTPSTYSAPDPSPSFDSSPSPSFDSSPSSSPSFDAGS
jgi:hypothetical protein